MHIIKVYPYIVNMSLLMSTCWTRKTVVTVLRPSHQTLERCPSGWGKGLRCCPSLRYFIKHICQNKLDNECSVLAKHEVVRPTKYLAWLRNGSKNGVPSFDY